MLYNLLQSLFGGFGQLALQLQSKLQAMALLQQTFQWLPQAQTVTRLMINEKNRRTHQEPRANGLSNFNFSLALPALLR